MQDRIEELQASIRKVMEDKMQLDSRNADLAKDLQVLTCPPNLSLIYYLGHDKVFLRFSESTIQEFPVCTLHSFCKAFHQGCSHGRACSSKGTASQECTILQAKDEQLRKLRAAEESALPASEDDDLAASYQGHLLLTVQGGKEMKLKPEQVIQNTARFSHDRLICA